MYSNKNAEIFISYSRNDSKRVEEIIDWLCGHGLDKSMIYRDKASLIGGRSYLTAIARAISNCKVLVFFISKNSIESTWVGKELFCASDENKNILPVFIEDVVLPPSHKLLLGPIHQIQLFGDKIETKYYSVLQSFNSLGIEFPFEFSENNWNRNLLNRIFDKEDQLKTDFFLFPISGIFTFAARRMHAKGHACLNFDDFIAGLIKKGNLTRYLLLQNKINPDLLYNQICDHDEKYGSGKQDASNHRTCERIDSEHQKDVQDLLDKFTISNKKQFHQNLADFFLNNFSKSVSEDDIIITLIKTGHWQKINCPGLPDANTIKQGLIMRRQQAFFDDNGLISFTGFDDTAIRIIKSIHSMAVKYNAFPITNRLILTVFLTIQGYGRRVCKQAGIDTNHFAKLLMQNSESNKQRRSVQLNFEASSRILLPVIIAAGSFINSENKITDRDLFKAFCLKSDNNFKIALKQPPISIDIDALCMIEPSDKPEIDSADISIIPEISDKKTIQPPIDLEDDSPVHFDFQVKNVINEAKNLAVNSCWQEITTPHLYVAMIDAASDLFNKILQPYNIDPDDLKQIVLSVVPGKDDDDDDDEILGLSNNVQEIVISASKKAQASGRKQIKLNDLFKVFFENGGGIVGEILTKIGMDEIMQIGIEDKEQFVINQKTLKDKNTECAFDSSVSDIIRKAANLANTDGWPEVKSPHLFLAMVDSETFPHKKSLQKNGINKKQVMQIIISVVPPRKLQNSSKNIVYSTHVDIILTRARDIAISVGRNNITEKDLLNAFFIDGGGIVGDVLKNTGLEILMSTISEKNGNVVYVNF